MKARVTEHSQVSVLRHRMEEAGIHHGDDVRADIANVLVRNAKDGTGEVLFCSAGPITVRETLSAGDHGPLPATAVTENVDVTERAPYDLVNVRIFADGDIHIVADERTRIRRRLEREQSQPCDGHLDKEPRRFADVSDLEFFDFVAFGDDSRGSYVREWRCGTMMFEARQRDGWLES